MQRLEVNVNEETADYLIQKVKEGQTATDTVHKAVSLYYFLKQKQNDGETIQITQKGTTPMTLLIM